MTSKPQSQPQPKTVSELFPSKFLSAEDLQGKVFKLKIAAVEFIQIHDRYEGDVTKAAIRFDGARKQLILNITQARAVAAIVGSEAFANWIGHEVILRPGRADNGKPTITIDPVPAQEMR